TLLATDWKWNRKKVERFLRVHYLSKTLAITSVRGNQGGYTLITFLQLIGYLNPSKQSFTPLETPICPSLRPSNGAILYNNNPEYTLKQDVTITEGVGRNPFGFNQKERGE